MNDAPIDMLTTSMPSLAARSMAASMMSVLVEPSQPKTRYAPRRASGAAPLKPVDGSLPAAMPATWVPCPAEAQSSGTASGVGLGLYLSLVKDPLKASPTKSHPATTFFVGKTWLGSETPLPPKARWSMSTPVSMTPILTPLPLRPSSCWA